MLTVLGRFNQFGCVLLSIGRTVEQRLYLIITLLVPEDLPHNLILVPVADIDATTAEDLRHLS